MRRDVGLKPRETADLPPENLRETLSRIYPEEVAEELFAKCMGADEPQKED